MRKIFLRKLISFYPIQDPNNSVTLVNATRSYILTDGKNFQFPENCRSILLFISCDFQHITNLKLNSQLNKEGRGTLQTRQFSQTWCFGKAFHNTFATFLQNFNKVQSLLFARLTLLSWDWGFAWGWKKVNITFQKKGKLDHKKGKCVIGVNTNDSSFTETVTYLRT